VSRSKKQNSSFLKKREEESPPPKKSNFKKDRFALALSLSDKKKAKFYMDEAKLCSKKKYDGNGI
jgi:hypothetical protein